MYDGVDWRSLTAKSGQNHLMNIPIISHSNMSRSSIRRILKFSQSETLWFGSHVEFLIGTKNKNFVEDHAVNIISKFYFQLTH